MNIAGTKEATCTVPTLRMLTCYTEDGMTSGKHEPQWMPFLDYPNPCICQEFSQFWSSVASFLAFYRNLDILKTLSFDVSL